MTPRRTPILAILLAPLALYLLAQLWVGVVVPLARTAWHSDTVLRWRLDSDRPEVRIDAARKAASPGAADTALLDELSARASADESLQVRQAAITSIGQLGFQQPLPAEARRVLAERVLEEQDDALLAAAVGAVGRSAPENQYADEVVARIARIFGETHLDWVYPKAAEALGRIGAAQPLPDAAFEVMNALFVEPRRRGEREYLAHAFREIATGRSLPRSTLDTLADAFEDESNYRIRVAIIYSLAGSARDYPRSVKVITAATQDQNRDVVNSAEHALRIIEHERDFGDDEPLSIAMDPSRPVEVRLVALRIISSSPIDPEAREQIAMLAQDRQTEVAVAALGIFHHLARAPDDAFDQRILIPALTTAMSDPDARVREAAYGALSAISIHRPKYLGAADFPELLETGVNDPDPHVRVIVLLAQHRAVRTTIRRDTVLERALTDPDPYVRRMATSWLGSPRFDTAKRQQFLQRALEDPDPNVRVVATTAEQEWESRDRVWPVELWQRWRAGDRGEVGMTLLIAVTVAVSVLTGGLFLIWYMARFLTYLQRRDRRAAIVVAVMLAWAAASYGIFMLYFVAALAGNRSAGEITVVAAILWCANVAYGVVGWGMHFLVRR